MKRISLFFIVNIIAATFAFSQNTAINTTGVAADNSAMLDISSTDQGILVPRLTIAQRNAIVSPANGLLIYNIDCNAFDYYNGSAWIHFANIGSLSASGTITGNATPCSNATGETYSVQAVSGATGYTWTVPAGASVVSGQGTVSITVDFGSSSGNVCVTASNVCTSSNASCLPITLQTVISAPAEGSHVAQQTQIEWNWNTVSGAAGYKWNTVDDYNSATDMGTNTTNTETSLNCETDYTRYVWAYNACGESASTAITETTGACCADATGGTITHVGGNTIHTFTYPGGTFTPSCPGNIQILVVAGGGSGGCAGNQDGTGGGGAGGLVYNASLAVTAQAYTVTVGAGGASQSSPGNGYPGDNSSFSTLITAIGGGYGSCENGGSRQGGPGGSGGGGGGYSGTAGIGTVGQGHDGGNCTAPGDGGGGGAGAVGQSGTTGIGGVGLSYSISGVATYYAGGGGASGDARNGRGPGGGAGGNGGGGNGAPATSGGTPTAGTPNTGGGGGGSAGPAYVGSVKPSGAGGSGVVIISYPTPSCSAPSAPTAGTHTPSDNQIIWNWNTSSGATGYKWNTVNTYSTATDNGASTSYTQTGLNCNTAYTLYVWAYNTCGNSGSATLTQSTSGTGTIPATPVASAGTGATQTQITANWNAASGATGYYLDASTDNNFGSFVSGYQNLNVNNVTSYNVTGLTCGTTYYYRVRAYNTCGTSGNSDTVSYSTSACSGPCGGVTSVQDYDGNTYYTTEIGSQCWIRTNMTTTTYRDGTSIGSANYKTYSCTACSFDAASCGKLYTWGVFMDATHYICPTGWHSPSENEFQTLQTTVGDNENVVKSPNWSSCGGCTGSCTGWDSWICGQYYSGHFEGCGSGVGDQSYFWSSPSWSTYGSVVQIMQAGNGIHFNTTQQSWTTGGNFYSVRCIKD